MKSKLWIQVSDENRDSEIFSDTINYSEDKKDSTLLVFDHVIKVENCQYRIMSAISESKNMSINVFNGDTHLAGYSGVAKPNNTHLGCRLNPKLWLHIIYAESQ